MYSTISFQQILEKNGNGKLANGGSSSSADKKSVHTNGNTLISTEEKQDSILSLSEESMTTQKSLVSRVANTCFVIFLILLLLIAVVIVLFERSDGSAHNDFIENNRALSDLRHLYYEPTRHYVVGQYRKYFGPKI
ncbi:hypothetical protein B9Z55_002264 [Caenorhabditis nigoni]|uniref:Uncharacterized protein n=1 Tax=Caenorhabditis nigoni TaxID=1611254 RepID=A0A2G5VJN0_9PELO|nr:hypothetical protein B9Z55_002264 [Caenorhabditis nigoni]